ncbi:MAG: hypothetical protein JXA13_01195 [Anaerolineales bacterium]|nr:hypothetical protein [Anaerolineales bacterium]
MSEINTSSTQPIPTKKRRWPAILIGVLSFFLIIGFGGFGGYQSGISDRLAAQQSQQTQDLADQYARALVDIQSGNYEQARQRLEYIIKYDAAFPGAVEKLAETMVLMTIPTATNTPTLTPTPDIRGVDALYSSAKQFIAAQDWPSALTTLDQVRIEDPTYKTAEVDGMYYFSLRNHGVNLINQGNLEGGIYHLSLAERFAPLDSASNGMREGARMYLVGSSFWELDWSEVVAYFSQVGVGWPGMWDGTMTASERYRIGSMRYGDELFEQKEYCAAYNQYGNAMAYGNLDAQSAKNAQEAYLICYPPTATPEPILTEAPTEEPPTEAPPTEVTP